MLRLPRSVVLVLTGMASLAAELPAQAPAAPTSAAAPAQPRRIVDPERPLILFPQYNHATEGVRQDLALIREQFPPQVRPWVCLFLSFGAPSPEGFAAIRGSGIPLLPSRQVSARSIIAEPFYLGFWAYETGFNFGGPGDGKHLGDAWQWLDRLRGCGGMVGWNSLFNLRPYFAEPANYRRIAANRDRLLILCKGNGSGPGRDGGPRDRRVGRDKFGIYIHDHEVLTGMYLAGAINCWGFHPEEWLWYESGYRRVFEYSLPNSRHRWRDHGRMGVGYSATDVYPECLIGQALLNAAINGCSLLSTETGWSVGGRLTDRCRHVHLPVYREVIARKLIPSRREIALRVRAASAGTHRKLYATKASSLQSNGRYGLIPWVPPSAPPEAFRNYEFIPGDYHYRYLPFLNALYPEEGRGRSFIARRGGVWITHNPYESVNRETDFEIPLYVNTCARLTGRLPPYSLAIVEEHPDRLEIFLDNYWNDRGGFWDWWAARDGDAAPGKVNVRAKCDELAVPRIRRTRLVLHGHAGPAAPAIEVAGVEGCKHKSDWDGRRYALDVDHNGVVRITLKASGRAGPKAPPQGLSRNLLLGRQARARSTREKSAPGPATDGIHATSWGPAGGGEQWLSVDLGRATATSACKVVGVAPGEKVVGLRLQLGDSADGPWRTVHEMKVAGEFFEVFALDAGEHTHARLVFPDCPEGLRLREWGLYTGPNDELKKWSPLTHPRNLRELLALLPEASSDAERAGVEAAAVDLCAAAPDKAAPVEEVIEAAGAADELVAASGLRILGRLGGGRALAAVRRAARDTRREVREAARWALAAWPDAAAAGDMLAVAREAADLSLRGEALMNLLKVLDQAKVSAEDRERMLAEGLTLAPDDRQKEAYFALVRKGSGARSLEAVALRLHDPDSPWLNAPARAACLEIAARLARGDPAAPRRTLEKVLAGARSAKLRDTIREVLKELGGAKAPALGHLRMSSMARGAWGSWRLASSSFRRLETTQTAERGRPASSASSRAALTPATVAERMAS